MKIDDGSGKGFEAKVNARKRLHVHSIQESINLNSTSNGESYNINTGLVTISGDATLMYVKNNEDQDLVIEALALGAFEGITYSDDPYITLIKNPTGGDLITDASDVSMKENRNFGSSRALVADAYKGKVGGTVTGGTDVGILQVTPGSRSFFGIDFVLPKGASLAIDLTANASSGSASYYVALICYLRSGIFGDD